MNKFMNWLTYKQDVDIYDLLDFQTGKNEEPFMSISIPKHWMEKVYQANNNENWKMWNYYAKKINNYIASRTNLNIDLKLNYGTFNNTNQFMVTRTKE